MKLPAKPEQLLIVSDGDTLTAEISVAWQSAIVVAVDSAHDIISCTLSPIQARRLAAWLLVAADYKDSIDGNEDEAA